MSMRIQQSSDGRGAGPPFSGIYTIVLLVARKAIPKRGFSEIQDNCIESAFDVNKNRPV